MFKVVYSNSMVQLAAHLAQLQQSSPLPPLEVETVVVQSNELTRWLSLFLAQTHGVASHITFPYPSAYIWALFHKILPDIPKESTFSTDVMTWRLYELLPDCRHQPGFEVIDAYLGLTDDPLKNYALANRIADTFDQYLMYRPDWIQAWEQGDKPHWQAMLWQRLTAGDDTPKHRANLLVQLKTYLSTITTPPKSLPSRMAIFGISALPPVYLDLFKLMAEHCDVSLYFLSPSEEYWGDLVDQKTQTKRLIDSPEQADYLVTGHPLLASLGKQGQEFFDQLQSYQPQEESLFILPENEDLLGQLQQDIYSLTDIPDEHERRKIADDDDSIMIHSCHSAMREIEVLHDQLLALFERHPDLSSTDIVVMTPDIELYTPWIDAVFGCAVKEHAIPYGIADGGIQQQSPVLSAFNSLLALPQSRFDVETIMTLLACPAIQKRFSLGEQQLTLIRFWIRETHIRWGLSAEDKTALALPAIEANTWRAGLDRLLLGYAMPLDTNGDNWGLFEGKLGFDGISGERAETMAQLCAFVDKLDRCRQRLQGKYDAKKWQQQLLALLDDFFVATSEQGNDEAELLLIRQSLDTLVETTQLAKFEHKMKLNLVKEWLKGHLDASQFLSRFMGQGVTFCGMVPMRSIPFPVVCLIGMNDASYPRRQATQGFDLLSKDFRKGDRSRRDDDRYLFLESVLSAQSHLYISYVGASIADNAPIPPSVLISDLRDVLRQSFTTGEVDDIWQQLLTQHPLQAFSRRYFEQKDNALFSYVAAHCPPDKKDINLDKDWFSEPLPAADDAGFSKQLNFNQLLKFFRHPGRFLLQERLGLRLDTDNEELETREPFALDGLQAWSLRQQLLNYRLQDKNPADALAMIQASGILPQAYIGEQVFNSQVEKVEQFADRLLADYPVEFMPPLGFELHIADFSLSGQLDGGSADGLFNYQMGKTKGNHLLTAWLRHLVLNCLKVKGMACESRLITENDDYHFLAVDDAKAILHDLLKLYWQGLHQPLSFFPNTSFAFAQAHFKGNKTASAIKAAWQGTQFNTGETDDIYYQQLYGSQAFIMAPFEAITLAVYEPIVSHLKGGKL
jgi:exodeoxyribonuclease V gamma subunit